MQSRIQNTEPGNTRIEEVIYMINVNSFFFVVVVVVVVGGGGGGYCIYSIKKIICFMRWLALHHLKHDTSLCKTCSSSLLAVSSTLACLWLAFISSKGNVILEQPGEPEPQLDYVYYSMITSTFGPGHMVLPSPRPWKSKVALRTWLIICRFPCVSRTTRSCFFSTECSKNKPINTVVINLKIARMFCCYLNN